MDELRAHLHYGDCPEDRNDDMTMEHDDLDVAAFEVQQAIQHACRIAEDEGIATSKFALTRLLLQEARAIRMERGTRL